MRHTQIQGVSARLRLGRPEKVGKMRKSVWIMLAVLLVAIGAPNARADAFTPVFTTNGCSGTCLLPTAPDVTFPSPTTMDVTFGNTSDGTITSVAIPSGDAAGDAYSWSAQNVLTSVSFILSDVTNAGTTFSCNGFVDRTGALSCGTLTFSAVTAPEPSSAALMLLGVGVLFVLRKRIGQGLPQAS
jgi:hypothetical protein